MSIWTISRHGYKGFQDDAFIYMETKLVRDKQERYRYFKLTEDIPM